MYFQWTLWDMVSTWGDNFMNNHLDCVFSVNLPKFYVEGTIRFRWMNNFTLLWEPLNKIYMRK